MPAFDATDLHQRGFAGFVTVEALSAGRRPLPRGSGVYAVLRDSEEPPTFLEQNPGSWFKRKDPTVPIESLRREWVDGVHTLYIGRGASLRDRIELLVEFSDAGKHKSVFHWGGRLLWQVGGSGEFLVTWMTAEDEKVAEMALIDDFVAAYGVLPFANLQRPR